MILRALLAFGYALSWVPIHVFRTEEYGKALSQYGRAEQLMSRLTPAAITAHVCLACVLLSLETARVDAALFAALAVHASGWLFWLWARSAIGPLHLRRLPHEPPRVFQRAGPYGVVRHPLYFSYLLICAAPVVAGHLLLLPTLVAVLLALAVRGAYEEKRLRQQIGPQYDDYARQVKRLLPFVW